MGEFNKNLGVYSIKGAWEVPFYNRERTPLKSELFDSVNGVYPNDDDWETDIILNLKASVDENGRVNDISYYKVKDMTYGHGRPVTEDRNLSLSDIKRFTEILNHNTLSRADQVIEPLLQTAKQKELPRGWKIKSNNAASVVFLSHEGKQISIPKKRIMDALEISYTYIDILFNPDFWDANTSVFKSDYKEPLLALFSLVDTSSYYHYEQLIEEAQKREESVERDYCYRQLCKAVLENNYSTVEKYAVYSKEQVPYLGGVVPPLYSALKQNNRRIAKILLANGALLSEEFTENGTVKNALCGAVESKDIALLKFCLKEEISAKDLALTMKYAQGTSSLSFMVELLKKGVWLSPGSEFDNMSVEQLIDLTKYNSIDWNAEQISRVYATGNILAVKRMLKSAQYKSTPKMYEGTSYERWTSCWNQSGIIQWIVSVGDESLVQFCSKLKYSIDIRGVDYWNDLLALPSSWAKPIKTMCLDKFTYHDSVQGAIREAIKNRDICAAQKLLSYYDAQIDSKCIRYASNDRYGNLKWKPVNEETLYFVIRHWSFPEAFQNGKDAMSWDRDRDFVWLFQAVIGHGSRDLCMFLFKELPAVFNCPSYVSSMKFYCENREVNDDVKDLFMTILSKHENC